MFQDTASHSETPASVRHWFRHADLSHPLLLALFARAANNPQERPVAAAITPGGSEPAEELPHLEILDIARVAPHALAGKVCHLPSLPHIFSQLIALMGDEGSSARDFEAVILQDPALTARVLEVVNSAYCGLKAEVSTVSRAVALIGTRELYALSLRVSVMRLFRHIPGWLVDMASFWEHSVACGVIAAKLAETTNYLDPERFFVGGLLHDIGRLVLYECLPQESKLLLSAARDWGELLVGLEGVYLEATHAEIGGALARRLNFPPELEAMLRFHHQPSRAGSGRDAAVLQVADILANFLGFGTSGERLIPPLDGQSWNQTGIATATVMAVLDAAKPQIIDMLSILLPREG